MPTVGTTFKLGNTTYVINSVNPIDPTLKRTIEMLKETGKDVCTYGASMVLRSGKRSKTSSLFYRFTETNRFIKTL